MSETSHWLRKLTAMPTTSIDNNTSTTRSGHLFKHSSIPATAGRDSERTIAKETLSVAFVSPGWPQECFHNGIVTYTACMRAALKNQGHRVFVLTDDVASETCDTDIVRLPVNTWTSRPLPRITGKIARRIAPTWWRSKVVTSLLNQAVDALAREAGLQLLQQEEAFGWAYHVAKRSPVPVVVRTHGPWFIVGRALGVTQDANFYRRIRNERLALRQAEAVSAPSHDVLERVRTYYDLELPRAEVIPNPITPARADQCWRLDRCDPHRVLFVGRFDRCKGGDVIIRAIAKVMRTYPSVRLTFVGPDKGLRNGSKQPCTLGHFIEKELPEPALQRHIECLDRLPSSEIHQLRQRCFLNVVSSRYETFGNTALEAMSLGCPLIVSHVGGLAEMVQHERNGLLARPGDPEDLANQILRLLQNRALAVQLGQQAAVDAKKRHHPDLIAQRTLDFYRRVIRQNPRGARSSQNAASHA